MSYGAALKGKAAIAGIGITEISKNSGKSTLGLAVEACSAAVQDAGLAVTDIDGIVSYAVNDSTQVYVVADTLGITDTTYFLDHLGGGSASQTTIASAAMAVHAGLAKYVLCYRALNSRSGVRLGGTGRTPNISGFAQYQVPYGHVSPGQAVSMGARAHMHRYGTTKEHLGHIAVQSRKHAQLHERGFMQATMTMEDYHASRMISDPLQIFDYCLESDGAVAFVVTSAERARDLPHKPVYIGGVGYGPGRTIHAKEWDELTECGGKFIAPRLYGMAGVTPKDIDVALLYDAFTYMLLVQLEDYGFCAKGEGGPFAASGALALDGALPTNPHGGHLSGGYLHGYSHVLEAVEQLRGVGGARQVTGAEVALVTGAPGGCALGSVPQCNALILHA